MSRPILLHSAIICRPSGSCKPDSVHPCGLCGHFSLHLLAGEPCVYSRVQLIPGNTAGRRPFPCLSCIARGFPCLRRYLRSGGLLPHLFTLTLAGGLFSVALSGHPALAPGVSCFRRTRCLMMSGLSSTGVFYTRSDHPDPDGTARVHRTPALGKPNRPIWLDFMG